MGTEILEAHNRLSPLFPTKRLWSPVKQEQSVSNQDLKKYMLSETAYLGKDLKLVLDKYPDKIKKKDLLKELELI